MRTTVSLYAPDLLTMRRTATPEPAADGAYQFASSLCDPYLYATADELELIADHFVTLAIALRKELARVVYDHDPDLEALLDEEANR